MSDLDFKIVLTVFLVGILAVFVAGLIATWSAQMAIVGGVGLLFLVPLYAMIIRTIWRKDR